MSALDRITIKGFKSIREQEIELKPLNVLIGANGAGKSNLIAVFRLLHQIIAGSLQLYVGRQGGAATLLHQGPKVTDELEISAWFGMNSYRCRLLPTQTKRFVFGEEVVAFHDSDNYEKPLEYQLGVGHEETRLEEPGKHERIAGYVLKAIRSWQIYHFHDTSESARLKQLGDLHDNRFLRPDGANLAAYLYLLQRTEKAYYRNIVDTIRMVAPFFAGFQLEPSRDNRRKIELTWQERGSDAYFNAHALSDGTLRFICLTTLLRQPPANLPTTILLDEPELGLHPFAINLLIDMLRSAACHTQLIVATQSTTLVNQLEPKEILVVDRVDGESAFRRLGEEEVAGWLDDYSLGELWEKNVFGGRPAA